MTRLALFDLDGTLSDDSDRAPYYVQGEASRYWNRDLMLADPAIPQAFDLIRALESVQTHIGILSSRQDELNREVTEEWLLSVGVYPAYIFLKPKKYSYMMPEEFKCMTLAAILSDKGYSNVVFYENSPGVVDYINARLPGEHAQLVEWTKTK